MSSQNSALAAGQELATAGIARGLPQVLFLEPIDPSSAASPALIAAELSREGWSTSIWKAQPENRAGAAERPTPWRPASTFENLKLLFGWLRSHDVVHIPCDSPRQIIRQVLPAIVLSRFFGRKPVLHFVSVGVEQLLERHRRWVAPILKLAGCAVAGSRYTLRILARFGLEVRLLPQPIEIDPAVHRIRSKLQPRVLVNTRLEPDLNVTAAIKAFRLVKQKYPRAELVIVGDGSERAKLVDFVAANGINGVEFHEGAASDELTRLYAECDLFLHCPLVDESPAALVRAFAHGLPVVTTDADGLIHMVRDQVSALVVPLGDHGRLSDAMIELVENQELCEKLSQQGRAEAEKYLWPRVRQDWVNLYKSMVN